MKIEKLIACSETECRGYIIEALERANYQFKVEKDYIFSRNSKELKPLVCVHTDTVNLLYPMKKDIVKKDNVLSLKQNSLSNALGADDRAGVWIALEMIKRGTKTAFEYAFFTGEEQGCKGSGIFCDNEDLTVYSCFLGLDRGLRNGTQNIALYDCDNKELNSLFKKYGYIEASGSYSDCSCVANMTEKACLNVSVGYQHEHSQKEILDIEAMEYTLDTMLNIEIPAIEYIAEETIDKFYNWRNWNKGQYIETDYETACLCENCYQHLPLYETNKGLFCEDCKDLKSFQMEF